MATRPAFQHQGPAGNCVIDNAEIGWTSCTAYAMAMLIDAATGGEHRPKGCRVRSLVQPRDIAGGLSLSQVAAVAEDEFDLPISVRTGAHAVSVARATEQITHGRGFLLQGNNEAFKGKGNANHAIWVNEVRGGTATEPAEALVFDPQRTQETWIPWKKVLEFGAGLRLDEAGTRKLGPGRLYAGFPPRRPTPEERKTLPPAVVHDGVELRFGAKKLEHRDRTRANPPAGRRINVRRTPRSLDKAAIVDRLRDGELFVAYQRVDDGIRPGGSGSAVWFGNKDGTEWIHISGLRRIGGSS